MNKIIYTPKGPIELGQKARFMLTRRMFRELLSSRELIWRLFVRDFSARYRQSILGICWAVIMPLLTSGIFVIMNNSGILQIKGIHCPYPLYAVIGISFWSLFSVGLNACAQSIVNAGSMVAKINFPKSSLIIAASAQGIVDLFIRGGLIAAMFAWYGIFPPVKAVIICVLLLIPLYLLTVGFGFILSLIACVVRDTLVVLNMILMAFLLMTPVLFPVNSATLLADVNRWNPLNYFVNVPRNVLIGGDASIQEFWWSSLAALLIFYVGWRLFYLAQTKIAERI